MSTATRLLIAGLIAVFVIGGTFFAVKFSQGYKIDFTKQSLVSNGILVTNSDPKGADVLVDGKLKTATNNSLSLIPNNYSIEINKDGFVPWKKEMAVEKELVTLADAFLFPKVPDLKPLTFDEVINPQISKDHSRIVFATGSTPNNPGLWIIDLGNSLFGIERPIFQIASTKDTLIDFTKAVFFWSPDSRQVILQPFQSTKIYLLDPTRTNMITASSDVSKTFDIIKQTWQKEEDIKEKAKYKKVSLALIEILQTSASNIDFSPDGAKILYVATASAVIPDKLIPPLPAASTQKETRQISPNKLYIYDIKEDRNFEIPFNVPALTFTPKPSTRTKITPTPSKSLNPYIPTSLPQWFPTSHHLVWIESDNNGDKIMAVEYDGTNPTEVFTGSFIKPYAFTTPDSGKIVILSNLSFETATPTPLLRAKKSTAIVESKPNLFSVSLR